MSDHWKDILALSPVYGFAAFCWLMAWLERRAAEKLRKRAASIIADIDEQMAEMAELIRKDSKCDVCKQLEDM